MNRPNHWAIVIHGGAANLKIDTNKEWWTESLKQKFITPLNEALQQGKAILEGGGSAVDAAQAAVIILEDCEWFNAGKGALYTIEGMTELDASIMDGYTGKAGAVGGVRNVKNPISLAKKILETETVMLVGEGAKAFAIEQGLELVDDDYYACPVPEMLLAKARGEPQDRSWHDKYKDVPDLSGKCGTVGAVALDTRGHLAAATSTGGVHTQRLGRVGDTGNIGAGTFADSNCGISCTGEGEGFIRRGVAQDIAAKVRYLGVSLDEAMREVIEEELVAHNIKGGAIGIDSQGNISMPFNTDSMMRGCADAYGRFEVMLT